jgi:hypothetical protein
MSAPELARKLGVNPKYLRALIRKHDLAPAHQHGARYQLDSADVARIEQHPAVQRAQRRRPGDALPVRRTV